MDRVIAFLMVKIMCLSLFASLLLSIIIGFICATIVSYKENKKNW